MSLAGAGVGAAVGNTSTNAVSGSLNAESAVENNYVTTIATKGRKVVQIAKQGKLPTGKDILPIAEAGLLVATACAITRECDGKEVLSDVWSGKFEDEFSLSSENINSSGNQKQSNNQLTNTSQTATGSPQIEPPDDENKHSNHETSTQKVEDKTIEELMKDVNKPINQQGLSQGARAWSKHAGRPNGTFEPLKGNVHQQNQHVANWIESVLKNPETTKKSLGRGGVSFRLPNGRGVAFEPDGRGNLLDPSHNMKVP